jgi:hypothetical protein
MMEYIIIIKLKDGQKSTMNHYSINKQKERKKERKKERTTKIQMVKLWHHNKCKMSHQKKCKITSLVIHCSALYKDI